MPSQNQMNLHHYITPLLRHFLAGICALLFITGHAQTLEIYQINITNGDAAVILTKNADGSIRKAVLIDGGQPSSQRILVPFLNEYIQHSKFDWIILSHYHDDHYKGLVNLFRADSETRLLVDKTSGSMAANKGITTKVLIDPGGYKIHEPLVGDPFCYVDPNYEFPTTDNTWPQMPFKLNSSKQPYKQANQKLPGKDECYVPAYWINRYLNGVAAMYKRNKFEHKTPHATPEYFSSAIEIDELDNGSGSKEKVKLRCVAMNSYNMKANGSGFKDTRLIKGGNNANNFSFAWILEFGKFRFYTGGDLGGHTDGTYIDQETDVAAFLQQQYPNNTPKVPAVTPVGNFPGHVCVYKANHHGSNESNYGTLLNTCAPTTILTSVGSNVGWHLPGEESLTRFRSTKAFNKNRNFFFTGLYAYPRYPINLEEFGSDQADESTESENLSACVQRRTAVIIMFNTLAGSFIGDQNHYKVEVKLHNHFPPNIHGYSIGEKSLYTVYNLPAPQKAKDQGPTTALIKKAGADGVENKALTIPVVCHE